MDTRASTRTEAFRNTVYSVHMPESRHTQESTYSFNILNHFTDGVLNVYLRKKQNLPLEGALPKDRPQLNDSGLYPDGSGPESNESRG